LSGDRRRVRHTDVTSLMFLTRMRQSGASTAG
jgi:hypothetical protein